VFLAWLSELFLLFRGFKSRLFFLLFTSAALRRIASSLLLHRESPFRRVGIQSLSLSHSAENSYVPSIEFSASRSSGSQHLAQILFCMPTIGLRQFRDTRSPLILSETFDPHSRILPQTLPGPHERM
jgi:hypothetical protein